MEMRAVHVCRAAPRAAAPRALHEVPLPVARQRAHPGVVGAEVFDERELDGEVLLRHSHRAAAVAMDDGDRRAPVALGGGGPGGAGGLGPRPPPRPLPRPPWGAPGAPPGQAAPVIA